jgi:hypothetical protein
VAVVVVKTQTVRFVVNHTLVAFLWQQLHPVYHTKLGVFVPAAMKPTDDPEKILAC